MADIKQENVSLMREMKLFEHYFFNFWKERCRDNLLERTLSSPPQISTTYAKVLATSRSSSTTAKLLSISDSDSQFPSSITLATPGPRNCSWLRDKATGCKLFRRSDHQQCSTAKTGSKCSSPARANISSKTVKQVILDAHGNAIMKSS
jgi:hypothetical protein